LPALARVEQLTCHTIAEDVPHLLRSPHWSRLRALRVKQSDVGDDAAEAISEAPWASGLKWLELSSSGLTFGGAQALLRAGLVQLDWLDLGFNEALAGRGALRLARAAELPALTGLRLVSTGLTAGDARRLAEVPELARLRHLEVGYNELRTGVVALAGSPHLCNLEVFDVSSSQMGTEGLTALAQSPHLGGITQLGISGCRAGPGMRQLMASHALRGLHWLDLGNNAITPDGAELLGSDDNPWELRHLDLRFAQLLDEGVRHLLTPKLSSLDTLILHANTVGPDAAVALARTPHLPNLRLLGLKNNRIGAEGATALARTETLQLLTLELETNVLPNEAKALLRQRYGTGVKFN
jgi:Ran GTPase-activating protein (RanGAP) involved in mRNA processing and transport